MANQWSAAKTINLLPPEVPPHLALRFMSPIRIRTIVSSF